MYKGILLKAQSVQLLLAGVQETSVQLAHWLF